MEIGCQLCVYVAIFPYVLQYSYEDMLSGGVNTVITVASPVGFRGFWKLVNFQLPIYKYNSYKAVTNLLEQVSSSRPERYIRLGNGRQSRVN